MSVQLLRRAARICALASVLFASASAQAVADGPAKQLRWYGDASSATGNALGQGSCDVNGDGYDDAVVGAWFWDKGAASNVGAAYVLFGGTDVSGGDLNTPAAAGAARIDGPEAGATVAFSVACAGDVDADGIDDLAIGYYGEEKAFIVLGATDFGSVDLALLGDRGFEIKGSTDPAYDFNVGFSMASAGDVNDDGFDDFAVAGIVADYQGRNNSGRVWIVAGKEDVADVDLLAPAPGEVLQTIDGAQAEARLGQIAPAGDVNGDGTDDVVLGAYTGTPHGPSVAVPGQAFVVFGGSGPAIDLAAIGDDGFSILGPTRQRDRLGISVSGAGDVDGDGFDDLLIGGDGVSNTATGERDGSAWVVRGSDSPATVHTDASGAVPAVYHCIDDNGSATCTADEKESRGYWIVGADTETGTSSESTGYSLSDIGDINGDDTPDFAIGAYGYDPVNPANPTATMTGAGAVFVVYGKDDDSTQPLATLTGAEGYRIDGLAAGDRFGRQVARIGDVDGNGTGDFAAAGDFSQRPLAPETPRSQAGEVMVALLGPLGSETTLASTATGELAVGEPVDLHATAETTAGGRAPVASGTVDFAVDGAPIAACQDVAVDPATGGAGCDDIAFDRFGTYYLSASYDGGADYVGSASGDLAHEVVEDANVDLAAPGAVEVGDEVVLEAQVESADSETAAGAGTVAFATGDGPISGCGAVPVTGGAAACTTSFAAAGAKRAVATYSGSQGLRAGSSDPVSIAVSDVPIPPTPEGPKDGPAGRIELSSSPVRVGALRVGLLGRATCLAGGCSIGADSGQLRVARERFDVELVVPSTLATNSVARVEVELTEAARGALRRRGRGFLRAAVTLGGDGSPVREGQRFELIPRSAG